MVGELEVLSCTYGCRGSSNQVARLGKYKFILFNDILVHAEPPSGGVALMSKKKSTPTRLLSGRGQPKKKDIKIKEPKKRLEWIWPLELVWLRDGSKTGFDIVGPNKSLSVMGDSQEIKAQWYHSLKTHIESKLMSQPKFNEIKDLTDLSANLSERFGRQEFHNKEIYTGVWIKGTMHGPGVLEFLGTTWEGNFVEGKKSSDGKYEYSDGTVYVGEFENGLPHGFGESTSQPPIPNLSGSDTYVGDWRNGRRHGVGDAIYANGDYYVGEWANGQWEGRGFFRTVTGIVYDGAYKEGLFHGSGVLESPLGVYEGEFEQGLRSGTGTMRYTDGSSYDGQWKDDRWHGKGTNNFLTGVFSGDFIKGIREGEGSVKYANGASYEGSWKDGRFNGSGLYLSTPGTFECRFEGEWEQGKKQKGVQSFLDGSKWEGSFTNGKISGAGKLTYLNGIIVEGKWKIGVREGRVIVTKDENKLNVDKGKDETTAAEYLVPESLPYMDTLHWIDLKQ